MGGISLFLVLLLVLVEWRLLLWIDKRHGWDHLRHKELLLCRGWIRVASWKPLHRGVHVWHHGKRTESCRSIWRLWWTGLITLSSRSWAVLLRKHLLLECHLIGQHSLILLEHLLVDSHLLNQKLGVVDELWLTGVLLEVTFFGVGGRGQVHVGHHHWSRHHAWGSHSKIGKWVLLILLLRLGVNFDLLLFFLFILFFLGLLLLLLFFISGFLFSLFLIHSVFFLSSCLLFSLLFLLALFILSLLLKLNGLSSEFSFLPIKFVFLLFFLSQLVLFHLLLGGRQSEQLCVFFFGIWTHVSFGGFFHGLLVFIFLMVFLLIVLLFGVVLRFLQILNLL